MAKSKKPHRRPGPGKPQGATYAQMLAHKAAVRKGLEQAARDATVLRQKAQAVTGMEVHYLYEQEALLAEMQAAKEGVLAHE